MEEMLKLIGNFGFPIAVTAFLLVRIEKRLNELSESITELAKAVAHEPSGRFTRHHWPRSPFSSSEHS